MLLAATGLLTPIILFVAYGLFDRFAPRHRPQQYNSRLGGMTREELFRYEQLRARVLEAARRRDWGKVLLTAGESCGSGCPPMIATLQAEAHWRTKQPEKAAMLWEPWLIANGVAARADFLALKGNVQEYATYVASLSKTVSPAQANDTAWAMLLLPGVLKDYTPVVELGQKALASVSPDPVSKSNVLNTLGVALYRAGRYDEARVSLEESDRISPETMKMMNTVFLALCYHHLKNAAKAQALADSYYTFLYDSLPRNANNRPEYVLFEKELRATVPPSKKAKAL